MSLRSSARGQLSPEALALVRYSLTVLWQMPQLLAMALLDRPASYLRRNTSLIFLIESLLFAMSPLS